MYSTRNAGEMTMRRDAHTRGRHGVTSRVLGVRVTFQTSNPTSFCPSRPCGTSHSVLGCYSTISFCLLYTSVQVLVMTVISGGPSSAVERDLSKWQWGLVDTCFEEGQYEAGISVLEEQRSRKYKPLP